MFSIRHFLQELFIYLFNLFLCLALPSNPRKTALQLEMPLEILSVTLIFVLLFVNTFPQL